MHGLNGVCDLTTADEVGSLRTALRLLSYLPDNNRVLAPFGPTSDPIDRFTLEEDILFRKTFDSAAGMSAPLDITLYLQQIVDHGEYFELQPARARNMITAFGRDRRSRGRLRRQQLRGRERADRRRRRAQGHPLHPLLQPLQHRR